MRRVHRVAPADDAEVQPDLIVEYANLYDPAVEPGPQAVVKGLDGSHVTEGMLILQGPAVRANYCLECAHIVDIAPTVLYLLGVPVPADMEGHVLVDALAPATLGARPPGYGPAARG